MHFFARALAIWLGLALLAAAPARAAICAAYDAPMTRAEALRLTGEVKDVYPAKYRALLDTMRVSVSDGPSLDMYVVEDARGSELVFPVAYLRTQCLLTMGVFFYSMSGEFQKLPKSVADAKSCPEHNPREDCLLQILQALVQYTELQTPELDKQFGTMLRILIQGSVQFGIAHEYGHLIVDTTWRGKRRPRDFDAELAADLQALQTMPAQQVLPFSDSLLFGGQLLLDAAHGTRADAGGPHEPTVCRAQRSSLIRQRLLPILSRLLARNRAAPLTTPATSDKPLTLLYLGQTTGCLTDIPPDVRRIEADLLRIEAFVDALPAREVATLPRWAAVERVRVDSQIGLSVRNAIAAGARVQAVIGNTAPTTDLATLERRLGDLDRVARDPAILELPSRDYQTVMYAIAMGRFYAAPPGASFAGTARALDQALTAVDPYGSPKIANGDLRALAYFIAGDCAHGYARLRDTMLLRAEFAQRFAGEIGRYTGPAPPLPPILQPLADRQKAAPDDEKALTHACLTFRGDLATGMRARYGWIE